MEQGLRTLVQLKKQEKSFTVFNLLNQELAITGAENYRKLRAQGTTIRKTADVMIATFCIAHQHALLFADKDFAPFVNYLGLQSVVVA